jgi:hypothetical protein
MLLQKKEETSLAVGMAILVRTQDELAAFVRFDFVGKVAQGGIVHDLVPALLLLSDCGRHQGHPGDLWSVRRTWHGLTFNPSIAVTVLNRNT